MPQIEVLSTDPGREVRVGQGARVIVLRNVQKSPAANIGEAVMGMVGTLTNDRGVPNVPVLLDSVQDIFNAWGGFSKYVGDGHAAGYNGNAAALLWRLLVKGLVVQPVDMAMKTASLASSGTDLKISIARGGRAFTCADTGELFTTADDHLLAVGDKIKLVTLTGGSGAAVETEYTVATVPTSKTFTLTGVTLGSNGSGTYYPTTWVGADLAQFTLPAGTRLYAGSFVVRTLEDIAWDEDEFDVRQVRFAHVSGTPAALNTVRSFSETLSDTSVIVTTLSSLTTVPDGALDDSAEVLLRYQKALDQLNVNDDGKSITVLTADRTEATINDALASHCAAATGVGVVRLAVIAPPVGTSVTNAKASSGNGVARATLNRAYVAVAHPALRRRFDLDQASLNIADDYRATFPAHVLLAAKMVKTKPEENPTALEAEPATTYGAVETETALSSTELAAHYKAGICATMMDRFEGGWVLTWRDGILANGVQIARQRLTDFLTVGAIARAVPYHKRLAVLPNRQALLDSVDNWLATLRKPAVGNPRIANYSVDLQYDGASEEGTLILEVEEIGNLTS